LLRMTKAFSRCAAWYVASAACYEAKDRKKKFPSRLQELTTRIGVCLQARRKHHISNRAFRR
jgi:hypothetical protein